MIDNNSLENRLNAVKQGEKVPDPPKQDKRSFNVKDKSEVDENTAAHYTLKFTMFNIAGTLIVSVLYGFGVQAIFGVQWNIPEIAGVGFIVNQASEFLPRLLKK